MFGIDDLTIYLDDTDERARPGAQVPALVAWQRSDQATPPGDWGNVGGYAIGSVCFLLLGAFCIYLLSIPALYRQIVRRIR